MAHSKRSASYPSFASRLLITLLCLASLCLCFSLFRRDAESPPLTAYSTVLDKSNINCNYSNGRWIFDPTVRSPPRYDHTCKEIFKGWNCIASKKSNAFDILKWRWKPYQCDLPLFDPLRFLNDFRDTNIGFIGDSLNRNMFIALFCNLRRVSGEVKKWRPVGADRGFTFLEYNLTIAYHRTNLLARYGGQPATMVACWSHLVLRKAIELIPMYLKERGLKLQVSMTYLSLTLDTGGGRLQSLTR